MTSSSYSNRCILSPRLLALHVCKRVPAVRSVLPGASRARYKRAEVNGSALAEAPASVSKLVLRRKSLPERSRSDRTCTTQVRATSSLPVSSPRLRIKLLCDEGGYDENKFHEALGVNSRSCGVRGCHESNGVRRSWNLGVHRWSQQLTWL